MQPRTIRDVLLAVLIALLGASVCFRIVCIGITPVARFKWDLTPLTWLIVSSVLGVLMATTAVFVTRLPRTGLSSFAIVLTLPAIPLVMLSARPFATVCFVILTVGLLLLEVGSVVGGLRAGSGQAALPGVFLGVTLLLAAAMLLFLGFLGLFPGLGSNTVLLEIRSPDGAWTLTEEEGGGDVDISISRVRAGMVEQERFLYWGDWGARPMVRWLDSRTVMIDGKELDIYSDPEVDGYER